MKMPKRWPWLIVFAASFAWLLLESPSLESYLGNSDHGVQLCQGREILLGKTPGIDLCTVYGALPGYSSALGLWLSGSLIGETVFCGLGYAAAISITGFLVSRYASQLAGFLAAGFAYLLMARFYKWYVWLFPLWNLLVLHGYLNAQPDRRARWALLTGAALGIEWLFRWDLGTSGLLASLFAIGLMGWQSRPRDLRQVARHQTLLGAGFTLPLAIWFGYLGALGGGRAIANYLAMLVDGSHGVVTGMAKSLPQFQWQAVLSEPSLVIIAYAMVPITYILCVLASRWAEYHGRPTAASRFLLLIALVGFSTLHQAMHRREAVHLIQVLPPAIIGAHLLVCRFLESPFVHVRKAKGRAVRFLMLTYFGLALICGLGLMSSGRLDFSGWELWPRDRFHYLALPFESESPSPPLSLLREIRRLTRPDQSILIFPIDCQYYAIVNRRLSGLLYAYYPGVFDGPSWRKRNMTAIEADPPALVAVRSDFLTPGTGDPNMATACWRAFPEVAEFVRQRYTHVLYNRDGLVLLGSVDTAPPPRP
jgi:hypothetical protein